MSVCGPQAVQGIPVKGNSNEKKSGSCTGIPWKFQYDHASMA